MRNKIDLQEFKSLYCFHSNSYVAQKLGISIRAVERRAYYHMLVKDPTYLSFVRSEIGRKGGLNKKRNETASKAH